MANRPTILVVDDTEANADVLVDILSEDYEVMVAMDGPTALEIAEEHNPDLILLDVMMPNMDGWEVCSNLKSSLVTNGIPVIFVTAQTQIEDEIKGFEMGAVDFITKPISPPVVRQRVRSTLALKEHRDRLATVSTKLGKYLSPQIYDSIFRGEQDAVIGAARKKLTVFLSDIVDFTATTERVEPEDMTMLLNNYLDRMAGIAMKHGGTVDKFIGDAVMVFFGDPISKGEQADALACVNMALEMRDAVTNLQKEWYEKGIAEPFQVRMGISSGYCTVGNFGSKQRMDYTIVGGQVNIAARLETHAAPGQILISHETWALVHNEIYCLGLPPIFVKGIPYPVKSYRVVGPKSNTQTDVEASIESLISDARTIDSTASVGDVVLAMRNSKPTDFLVVVDDGVPRGLLCKFQLDALLGTYTERAILIGRSVIDLADQVPLILDAATPLEEAARLVVARPEENAFSPVIVTSDGRFAGTVFAKTLIQHLLDVGVRKWSTYDR